VPQSLALALLAAPAGPEATTHEQRTLAEGAVWSGGEHYWPAKNGDARRTGYSRFVAPRNLTVAPTWQWFDEEYSVVSAAPLIDAERNVYIMTRAPSYQLVKFTRQGRELWRFAAGDTVPEVPALMDDSIYLATETGRVISVDAETGHVRWNASVGDQGSVDTWSMSASDGTILASTKGAAADMGGGRLVALDTSGVQLWQFSEISPPTFNVMPAIVRDPSSGDMVVVFDDSGGNVYKLSLATGQLIWKAAGAYTSNYPGFGTGGSIVGPDDTVYVTSNEGWDDGPPDAMTIMGPERRVQQGLVAAYALGSGALKWSVNLGENCDAQNGPAIGPLDGPGSPLRVVVAVGPVPDLADEPGPAKGEHGVPYPAQTIALDAETGAIVWRYDMPTWHGAAAGDGLDPAHVNFPDSSANAAIGGDGFVYVPHEDGVVYAMRDDDGDGVISAGEVTSHDFGYSFQGSPAIAPGMLAVAPSNGLAVWLASER